MQGYFFNYLHSGWGLAALFVSCLCFGLKTYDVFAKIWPATTGRFVTKGWITWSELVEPELALLKQALTKAPNEGLISYSYEAGGSQHNGTIPTEKLTRAIVDKHLYKGAEVDVFYSPKLPHYSYARKPPSQAKIAGEVTAKWFVAPVFVLNALSFFIWFLANA
jgi:hypothetical protein